MARLGWTIAALALAAALAAGALLFDTGSASGEHQPWATPVSLGCARPGGPAVVFPRSSPFAASAPGALLWSPCAAHPQLVASRLDAADTAVAARAITAGELAGTVTSTGAGRFLTVVRLPGGPTAVAQDQGVRGLGGPSEPLAATSSYVGDAAIASLSGDRIVLRRENHGASALSVAQRVTDGPAPITALAINLDYRGDALVAWQQQHAVYAREVSSFGRRGPLQRLGSSGPDPSLSAIISDDGRGMVAWVSQSAGGGATTVNLSISGPGLRFAAPTVVESFAQPGGFTLPPSSARLVRVASEAVLFAWTGMSAGRYAVRAAAVSLAGLRAITTLTPPGTDAVLAALATGPRSEAIALSAAAPRRRHGFDARRVALFAQRGFISSPATALFHGPERVATAGPNNGAQLDIDPATDRTVAVWRRGSRAMYAIRRASPHGL